MWRYAAQSRFLVEAICVWAFVILVHIQTYNHINLARTLLDSDKDIRYAMGVSQDIGGMARFGGITADMKALQDAYSVQWTI